MRLFKRYNRLNITATILVFFIGSVVFYFTLHYILMQQVDQGLFTERNEVLQYVQLHNRMPEIVSTSNQQTQYKETKSDQPAQFQSIHITGEGPDDFCRQISFTVHADGKNYLVTVTTPLEETEDLWKVIIIVVISMIALMLLVMFLINRNILDKLWRPFYKTIDEVKAYNLSGIQKIELQDTDIDEFALLNQSLNKMIERIQQDYVHLKEFTSRAAHEMQTPLAILRSKIDVIVQNEGVLVQNAQQFLDVENALHRISRLNKSLLLLSKIENRQFLLNEPIDIKKIIEEKCGELSEMLEVKQLKLVLDQESTEIPFHSYLAEVIVGNLVNNAVRYNITNGEIVIRLSKGVLSIANTSYLPELPKTEVFQKFYRHPQGTEEGNGLGLSIVREICELGNFELSYAYEQGKQCFFIKFY